MKVTLLGTGTSIGVPVIGCKCDVCTSTDPRDHRLRCSALVETDGKRILIDCGPDFRTQILPQPYGPLDAVLITHRHYDHVGGIDDLRPFCPFGNVNIYGDQATIDHIRTTFYYCFGTNHYPGSPSLCLHTLRPLEPLHVGSIEVLPVRLIHGTMPILGYRFGRFAYLTDLSECPPESFDALQGIDTLVVDGLRRAPHSSHQTIGQACELSRRLGANRTYIIHLTHTVGLHARSHEYLPQGVEFGYDGQVINI